MTQEYPLPTVGGLIVAPDGEILFVKSTKWKKLYSIPGGKIEMGETREQAFVREVFEETSLKIIDVYPCIDQDCIFSTDFYKKRHFIMHDFIAKLSPESTKDSVVLNDEATSYLWLPPLEAKKLPLHREVQVLLDWYISKNELGQIGFDHLLIPCIIGTLPEERNQEQKIFVDLKVSADFSHCAQKDDLQHTVNYVTLANICTEIAQKGKFQLLETYAWEVLKKLFIEFKTIEWAWIKVKKPQALSSADFTTVELKHYRR